MDAKRFLRYLAPNLVTFASLAFGMMSLVSSLAGDFVAAAWFVIFSVLTDKLDGFVARLLKGTSEFGVQLDSFADFLNFGIAPATMWYAFLSRPGSPVTDGVGRALVIVAVGAWVLAVTFRLARYNIVGTDPACKRVFFGVPTTLMGGLLCTLFLTFLKYGADPAGAAHAAFDEPRLLGDVSIAPGAFRVWSGLILVGAFLMASTIKIPKLGRSKSRALTVFIMANVLAGYAAGASRHFPEYLVFGASLWIVGSVVWGQFSTVARTLKPPPIFPPVDRPASELPQRPEEDVAPEELESVADDDAEHDGAARAHVVRSAGG